MINPDTFCIAPWSEVRINPDGSMNFCHAADNRFIPDHENISNLSVHDFFQGRSSVLEARNQLLQGEPLDRCQACYRTEQIGLVSFRQRRNLQAAIFPGQDFVPSYLESWPRISNWSQPKFYHISLSNLCNLSCMMCDPRWSSQVATTFKKIGFISEQSPVLRDWTENDKVWDAFVQHLLNNNDIQSLHFMGGEPLYHKKFHKLLDHLLRYDHCDFEVSLVTNGSIYDASLISQLEHFRSVAIEISLESVDLSNDYIRYPGSYRAVCDNIDAYLDHRTSNFDVVLRSVPQFLSALHYDRLLDFARSRNIMIDHNVLHRPDYMKLNVLPDEIKQEVIHRISKFLVGEISHKISDINLRDHTDLDACLSRHARAVIDLINEPCLEIDQKQRDLVMYCSKMDAMRKINVADYVPDLQDFFHQHGYEPNKNRA